MIFDWCPKEIYNLANVKLLMYIILLTKYVFLAVGFSY